MYGIIKSILFLFAPERAHAITVKSFAFLLSIPLLGRLIRQSFRFDNSDLKEDLCGLSFKNPVGLAAGFDKDGKYIEIMEALGFSHIEVGTVTPQPQAGNPKPRLFRLPKDHALINRMGFNNEGVEILTQRLRAYREKHPDSTLIIGGNIGKNKVTPNEQALDDYIIAFTRLHPYVNYFTVNVSSPNTPNLRDLQQIEPLRTLLTALQQENDGFDDQRPIFLKIAPDVATDHLLAIVDLVQEIDLDGIIATNTTISRSPLSTSKDRVESMGAGGLSGQPLKNRSTQVIRTIRNQAPDLPIIGIGGIRTPRDAKEKLDAGANLVQVYTGLIYAGPTLVRRINEYLIQS